MSKVTSYPCQRGFNHVPLLLRTMFLALSHLLRISFSGITGVERAAWHSLYLWFCLCLMYYKLRKPQILQHGGKPWNGPGAIRLPLGVATERSLAILLLEYVTICIFPKV